MDLTVAFAGFFKAEPKTLAEQVNRAPKLLSGEFTLCTHKKGFWYGSEEKVSDESGSYLRLQGNCKKCDEMVYKII